MKGKQKKKGGGKGKRAKIVGGMIRQFQNGVDSMRDKYLNSLKKKNERTQN